MIYSTRLAPTMDGQAHLGHAYIALVNQTEAHRTGGKFGVRFDDSQRAWLWACGVDAITRFKDEWREDLDWLGIKPDWYSSQSELMSETERLAQFLGHELPPDTFGDLDPCEVIGLKVAPYPPDYRLTAEHVLQDFREKVNLVIRGHDLLSEDCAYDIIRRGYELPRVRRVYIPRLLFDGDEVSKTLGTFKVQDFRKAGMSPDELIANLAEDCLRSFHTSRKEQRWTLDNINPNPTLGTWAAEALK